MRRLFVLITVLVSLSLACANLFPGDSAGESGSNVGSVPTIPAVVDGILTISKDTPDPSALYAGLNLSALDSYLASYEIHFQGSYTWSYSLIIRANGQIREINIITEGVRVELNPGDLRIVTNGATTWMKGPGTDNECFFFPSSVNLGAVLVTPDIIVSPEMIEPLLIRVGEETQANIETIHYTLSQQSVANWQNTELDLWLSNDTSTAIRYDLQANGDDPAFDAGFGLLQSQFMVHEIGPQTIEPVSGCEIGVPLPPDAVDITHFPGVTSFYTNALQNATRSFFQNALPLEGWKEAEPPFNTANGIVLSYTRGNQSLQIQIDNQVGGVTKVEIILV